MSTAVMDPTVAFSLVCGIVQLVDFSAKVVKKCHELYKDGVSSENREAEEMASHLTDLRANLDFPDESVGNDLLDLATKCSRTAEELVAELEKLKVDGPHRKRQVARKTFRTLLKGTPIDRIQKRLAEYEKHLDTRVLVDLRFVVFHTCQFIMQDCLLRLSSKYSYLRSSNLLKDSLSAGSWASTRTLRVVPKVLTKFFPESNII